MAELASFTASKSQPTLLHSAATRMAARNDASVDAEHDDDNTEAVPVVEPMMRGEEDFLVFCVVAYLHLVDFVLVF
jgi:hypothetical protein